MSLEHELEDLRLQCILQTLNEDYPTPMRVGSIFEELEKHPELQINESKLERAIGYLRDRQYIRTERKEFFNLAYLLPAGVDAVEHHADFDPKKLRHNRLLRLRVLSALDSLRPNPLSEHLVRAYLRQDANLDLAHPNIPRAQAYLAQCGLIELTADGTLARILPPGVDYLAGKGADLPGVARPAL